MEWQQTWRPWFFARWWEDLYIYQCWIWFWIFYLSVLIQLIVSRKGFTILNLDMPTNKTDLFIFNIKEKDNFKIIIEKKHIFEVLKKIS